MIQLRVFTIQEANALIPDLARMIVNLRESRERIEKKEAEIDALELVTESDSPSGRALVNSEVERLNLLIADFNASVDALHGHGCFLKDVEMGLVDFYSVIDGKVVYLCWKYGEEEVSHWHEVGEGYASRQRLAKEKS